MTVTMTEDGIEVTCARDFRLDYVADRDGRYGVSDAGSGDKKVTIGYNGQSASIEIVSGRYENGSVISENGRAAVSLKRQ